MPPIDADVIIVQDTEANILAGLIKVGQKAYATDTHKWITRISSTAYEKVPGELSAAELASLKVTSQVGASESLASFAADGSIIRTTVGDGSKKPLWQGFVDPSLLTAGVSTSGLYTITSTSGVVEYWSSGVKYSFANGAPELQVQIPVGDSAKYYFYHNSGANYEIVKNSDFVLQNYTLGPVVIFDPLGTYQPVPGPQEIVTINRCDIPESNEIENYASYKTKTLSVSDAVLFEGTLLQSEVGHTGGEFFSVRDFQIEVAPSPLPSKTWAVFYLDGKETDGVTNKAQRIVNANAVPYITSNQIGIAGPNQLVFNASAFGIFSVSKVANNDFVLCHYAVGDSTGEKVTSILGQETYNTLNEARGAIETERTGLVIDSEVFKDVAIIATSIFKNNNGVGSLEYVDTNGNLFNYPSLGTVSFNSPGAKVDTLSEVLTAGNDAQAQDIVNVGDVQALTGTILTLASQVSTSANHSAGIAKFGENTDLGAAVSITAPASGGYQFATNVTSVTEGLYVENGTGGDFGDPKYEYNDGATLHIMYSGDVTGVKYWFVGQTIETGPVAFSNCEYRQLSGGANPNTDTYTGVNAPETARTGTATLITAAAAALITDGGVSHLNLPVGLPGGKTKAGGLSITTDGIVYIE